jgi:hypothetical protein
MIEYDARFPPGTGYYPVDLWLISISYTFHIALPLPAVTWSHHLPVLWAAARFLCGMVFVRYTYG